MRIAIMESVVTSGGHEIDYDRILAEEFQKLGHEVTFYVPEGHCFRWNCNVPILHMKGCGVSYQGAKGIKKWYLAWKREQHRLSWYEQLAQEAAKNAFDVILFPSATYRYLRDLRKTRLFYAKVPLLFIIHGLTPKEVISLTKQANASLENSFIQIGIQTFTQNLFDEKTTNIHCFPPPVYTPRDISLHKTAIPPKILRLGFFGQYRREKNLDAFLEAYLNCEFQRPTTLLVQGATTNQADAEDFEQLITKYSHERGRLTFLHKALLGQEWQKAIGSVDAIIMPYTAPRYRYHTSAMLSTAIGYYKPVIVADSLNPEVLDAFKVGRTFHAEQMSELKKVIQQFVNNYDKAFDEYQKELTKANQEYSPEKLVKNIINMIHSS